MFASRRTGDDNNDTQRAKLSGQPHLLDASFISGIQRGERAREKNHQLSCSFTKQVTSGGGDSAAPEGRSEKIKRFFHVNATLAKPVL